VSSSPTVAGGRIPADACRTMADVRAGVDSIDRELVGLLAERMHFMSAAARIKPDRGQVRDEARKAQVLANVRRAATAEGFDPALAEQLWDALVEASIAHEFELWDHLRQPVPGGNRRQPVP
jgi:isochorismate pyruvate lyase